MQILAVIVLTTIFVHTLIGVNSRLLANLCLWIAPMLLGAFANKGTGRIVMALGLVLISIVSFVMNAMLFRLPLD